MDSSTLNLVIGIAAPAAFAVIGWLVRNNYVRHDKLQCEFQDFKVKVATDYVTSLQMDKMETRIIDAIKGVEERLTPRRLGIMDRE